MKKTIVGCHVSLHKECPQHHGHKGDLGGKLKTCGVLGEGGQVVLVWVRA